MMERMLIASVGIFLLTSLWMLAVQAGQKMAHRYPELGRYREEGGACGVSCGCKKRSECRDQRSEHDKGIDQKNLGNASTSNIPLPTEF